MPNSAPFTSNVFYDNSTDAHFRSWGSALSAAWAGLGFVQTADTGQVNWTTVTHPTLANTFQGYEVWKANDALQSTCPIFFKVEYGSSSTTNNPSIRVTLGTGSDGAGTILQPSPLLVIGNNGGTADATNQYECDFSGCASGGVGNPYTGAACGIVMFRVNSSTGVVPASNMPWMICIERSLDNTGAYTGDYWTFLATWSSSQAAVPAYQITMIAGGGFGPINSNSSFSANGGGCTCSICTPYFGAASSTLQNATYLAALCTFPLPGGGLGNPLTCFMHCSQADVSEAAVGVTNNKFTVQDAYGNSHTYATFKGGGSSGFYNTVIADGQTYGILLRWE
jgi:hypothetical protein